MVTLATQDFRQLEKKVPPLASPMLVSGSRQRLTGKARNEMIGIEKRVTAEEVAQLELLLEVGEFVGPLLGAEIVLIPSLITKGMVERHREMAHRITGYGEHTLAMIKRGPICSHCGAPGEGLCSNCTEAEAADRDTHERNHMPGRV